MKLVQKFSVGLGLACVMMMSSCSKEDVQMPEPQPGNTNTHSNLRVPVQTPYPLQLPYLAPTYGPTGFDTYPTDWKKDVTGADHLSGMPAGTSSLTHLFGNIGKEWKKPLPPIPIAINATSILTVTSHANFDPLNYKTTESKRSTVVTKIKNLTPGKLYEITCYAASTVCKVAQNGYIPTYAQYLTATISGEPGVRMLPLGEEATWTLSPIIFEAKNTEVDLRFSAYSGSDQKFTYAHIFIDKNSIKLKP